MSSATRPQAPRAGIGKEPPPRHPRTPARLRRAALPLGSLLLFLTLWQLLAAGGTWSQTLVPPPAQVWDAFVNVSTTHDGVRGYNGTYLVEHLGISLRRIAFGAGIGIGAGVVFGLLMGTVGWMRSLFEPWITFLRTLPPLAYFSLLIIWLGINEEPKITLLAVAAFPPVAVSTTTAVAAVPSSLIEAARALGASRWDVVRDVLVPSALPETLTGVRLAVGVAYSSLVAAELVNGLPGIGGMVKDAANYNNTPVVLVGIIAIGVSGLFIDGLLLRLERTVVPWRGRV
ncbi:putative ABC-type nitrate/sulfonate/bicarbonate transport system, permease component [Streptomyces ambofaciens ATCC 23877]|uniref:ABC transporter permease n=2 Tax=Streptomyces ambofaciens TaxID=1889 RepID=A0ABM6BAA7_STRAM|nr:ABC transporter permease [Streptomyces ambofaciens]AKZ60341.1 putative ABC-type nitrate/sulfonate/bicarbonate transport system, permease component [Streptomyces ambofaciens ATCC 23877]ANB10537.1 ABC transporter permease [Streptomyces ambofaciens]CAJ88020.1 putative ABC-type nitrate/sulfonate/bicarbonate transport system, permease component [Streptomyces ambofaciens ATCC 23877]